MKLPRSKRLRKTGATDNRKHRQAEAPEVTEKRYHTGDEIKHPLPPPLQTIFEAEFLENGEKKMKNEK